MFLLPTAKGKGKVMFSEASVSHSVHSGGGPHPGESACIGGSASRGWGSTPSGVCPIPPVPTSSGSHCSGRYASYWNAFLFLYFIFLYFSENLQNSPQLKKTHPTFQHHVLNVGTNQDSNDNNLLQPNIQNVQIDKNVKYIFTLGPAYNEFGYNEHPAIMTRYFCIKIIDKLFKISVTTTVYDLAGAR